MNQRSPTLADNTQSNRVSAGWRGAALQCRYQPAETASPYRSPAGYGLAWPWNPLLVESMKSRFKQPDLAADSPVAGGCKNGATCPACESPDFRTLFEATDRLYRTTNKNFQIIECRQCRLLRLFPQPDASEVRAYYPDNYWFSSRE